MSEHKSKTRAMPVVNVSPEIMPMPGMTSWSPVTGESAGALMKRFKQLGIVEGVCVMSIPGMTDAPDRFYKVGVIVEFLFREDGSLGLSGKTRGRILNLKNQVHGEVNFWSAQVKPIRPNEHEEFQRLIYRQVMAKLLRIRNVCRAIGEEKPGDWSINPVFYHLVHTFGNNDFTKYEAASRFLWAVALVMPDPLQEDIQPILEARTFAERLDATVKILEEKLAFLREYKRNTSISVPEPAAKAPAKAEPTSEEKEIEKLDKEIKSGHPDLKRLWAGFRRLEKILPADARHVALEDIRRLLSYGAPGNNSHEWPKFSRRLNLINTLPWGKEDKQETDIRKVVQVLDEDHYGLKKPKEKIYDQMATLILNPEAVGQIICFVGPPGVGKTSLAKSIARALNRKLVRMSVGGIRDESQIRGHNITYTGSQPGEIIREMARVGVRNPVFLIDEIDKMGQHSVSGNPSAAMLEVLDSEQNYSFKDHYLDCGFDLSRVLFITTANVEDEIPPALRDRMDVIHLPGYLISEKVEIAKRHLIPRNIRETGIEKEGVRVEFVEGVLPFIIQSYTREAGVRDLNRILATLARRIARRYLFSVSDGELISSFVVDERMVRDFLGPEKYLRESARQTGVGEAIGLAWTAVGGEILYVQTKLIPRLKEQFVISQTGRQGEVMKEANKVAMTLVRDMVRGNPEAEEIFAKNSVHIHIPDGSIPKDGPSAGVTALSAIYSQIMKRPLRPGVGMTGEINLSGRVTAIGGLREKVVAAEQAGLSTVILPKENERNLHDVPDSVKEKLTFVFVETVEELLSKAFEAAP